LPKPVWEEKMKPICLARLPIKKASRIVVTVAVVLAVLLGVGLAVNSVSGTEDAPVQAAMVDGYGLEAPLVLVAEDYDQITDEAVYLLPTANDTTNAGIEVVPFQRARIQTLPHGASDPTMGGSGDISYEPTISAWTEYDINGENHRWVLSLKQMHFSEEDYAQSWFEFWLRSHYEMAGQARHVEQFMLGDTEAFVLSRFTLEQLKNLGQPIPGGAGQAYELADETTIILHWVQGSDFFELRAKGQPGAVTWSDLLTIAESVR
jgi:hypothetical protein